MFKHSFRFSLVLFISALGIFSPASSLAQEAKEEGSYIEQQQAYALKIPRPLRRVAGALRFNGATFGSGFLYAGERWIYIVTAKHNLVDLGTGRFKFPQVSFHCHFVGSAKDDIAERFEIALDDKYQDKSIFLSERDVAAIRIGRFAAGRWKSAPNVNWTPTSNGGQMAPLSRGTTRTFGEAEETNDVIVFGFPSDLERIVARPLIQFDPDWPIFRKGMVAQINRKNKTIIIDGMVHGGNSGSPAFRTVFLNSQKEFHLIGVVIQKLFDTTISTNSVINGLQNAGYAVVEPSDSMIELVKKAEQSNPD